MPEPTPLPMRVLVKGASTVVWTSWMGGPRTDLAYPRVIEEQLLRAGQPAEVRVTAVPAEKIVAALKYWEYDVGQYSPDVVVLHYGHTETIHLFLPQWFERHVNSLHKRPGKWRDLYRKRLLRPTYMALAKTQARLDAKRPDKVLHKRLAQVVTDMERLIENVHSVASPLILIPKLPPHGHFYDSWFPGMQSRIDATNEAFAQLVEKLDKPNIRVFRSDLAVAPGLAELADDEEMCPDGGHYTPVFHRLMGEAMAEVILEWAQTQTHLRLPDSADVRPS